MTIRRDGDVANLFQPFGPEVIDNSQASEQTGSFRIAYICFDVVPAPKGAAVHIEAFATALGTLPGSLDLVTVSPTGTTMTPSTQWPGVRHIALPAVGKTLIDRVLDFRRYLWQWLQEQPLFDVIQIRSIYEGFPIALNKKQVCRQLFFEVNGMPSIELKYRYPKVMDDQDLMTKILHQEAFCLAQSDRVITPSAITRDYLIQRDVPPHRIHVIPNGVNLDTFTYRAPASISQTSSPISDRISSSISQAPSSPQKLSSISQKPSLSKPSLSSTSGGEDGSQAERSPFKLLYIGTLSAWQGVELAIDALALYCRDFPAKLTIIGPVRGKQDKGLMDLAAKLGVADRVSILPPMPQAELVGYMHNADAIAAPLKPNDRNLVQGCCPLKVLEAMATGTPVITSDLPVIHEFGINNVHFLAVRPGSAKAIKDAMLQLSGPDSIASTLARQAYQQVQATFSWRHAQQHLLSVYLSVK